MRPFWTKRARSLRFSQGENEISERRSKIKSKIKIKTQEGGIQAGDRW